MLKLIPFIIIFIAGNCFAVQTPSNALQVQYQKTVELENNNSRDFNFELRSVSQIPKTTFRYLDNIFSSFYKKLTFNTSIIESTFDDTSLCELFSVPLIAPNEQGLQMEVFANFSDLSKQYLSNLSADHALHDYIAHSEQVDFQNSNVSLGAGFSLNTSQFSKIKFIISNNEMPGYGNSKILLGFERSF